MSTRSTLFELDTPSATFDVHDDLLCSERHGIAGTPGLLVYCRLKGDERGNGYGHINDDQCGIFYVSRDDFAALCRRYLEHIDKEPK